MKRLAVRIGDGAAEMKAAARARRAEIVHQAGIGELARGTLVSIQPANAVEEMLLDLLAAAYNGSLRLITKASIANNIGDMVKLSHASARLMGAFTDGAEALRRLRGGPQQTVMQRVVVADGGQAVVAASTGAAGRHGATVE